MQPGDNVKVLYRGFLENGEKFIDGEVIAMKTNLCRSWWDWNPDCCVLEQDDAIEFRVGSGEVVVGLEQGVVGMQVGEKRILTIPPAEGFGEPDQELVYDVPTSDVHKSLQSVGIMYSFARPLFQVIDSSGRWTRSS